MGGGYIRCGDFKGEDKSGSPSLAVLTEAFQRAFGRKPRGRIGMMFGRRADGIEGAAEDALLSAKYADEQGTSTIPSEVAAHLLPFLTQYRTEVLARLDLKSEDSIHERMARSTKAKYGLVHDDRWHAYCVYDLVKAFERSVQAKEPVHISWD